MDCSDDEFVASEFYQSLRSLLGNPDFLAVLKAREYRLKIYLHFYFHRFITTFDIPTGLVELLAPETDLLPYILDSSILITDYSSVARDFFYLDKPVLFFQPDLDTYLRERGSYLDLRTDLFGPQSFTPAELASQVDYAIVHHASLVEKYVR